MSLSTLPKNVEQKAISLNIFIDGIVHICLAYLAFDKIV